MKYARMVIIPAVLLTVMLLPACNGDDGTATVTGDDFPVIVSSETMEATETSTTETETTVPEPTTGNVTTTAVAALDFRVVGYITHWHISRLREFDLDMLTHLIWQGVEVTSGDDPALRVAEDAGWDQIKTVVKTGHEAGLKVLVSLIGPWDNMDMNEVWEDPGLRRKLVENIVEVVEEYGLDGVDVDNENPCEEGLYDTFIDELHAELVPLDKMVTLAAHPNRVCISVETAEKLDFINLMTYDMYKGRGYPYHSTYEESINSVKLWEEAGIPGEKLNMGIPFYGRDAIGGGYEYRWIVDTFRPGSDQNEGKSGGKLIWWNGPELVKEKVAFLLDNEYGGVMVYEIGQDTPGDGSLLVSIDEEIRSSTPRLAGALAAP